MPNKEDCKRLFEELVDEIDDLESTNFRALWFFRLGVLRENGCWWHYMALRRKARDKCFSNDRLKMMIALMEEEDAR